MYTPGVKALNAHFSQIPAGALRILGQNQVVLVGLTH